MEILRYGQVIRENGWCAFYPDIPHRINVLESGYRAILNFKIFIKEPSVKEPSCLSWGETESNLVNAVVDEIEKAGFPLGILMKHHYGYDSNTIYGCDKLLLDCLRKKGFSVEIKPVLIYFEGVDRDWERNDPKDRGSIQSSVYSLTNDTLNIVRPKLENLFPNIFKNSSAIDYDELENTSNKRQKNDVSNELLFIDGIENNSSGLWEENKETGGHLGNESRPYSETSVYVRYAAIVNPLKK